MKNLIFVFDRIPDNEGCNFIEVENESGDSVCAGEWRLRDDGLAELVVPVSYGTQAETLRADTAEAELKKFQDGYTEQWERAVAAEQRVSDLSHSLKLEIGRAAKKWFYESFDDDLLELMQKAGLIAQAEGFSFSVIATLQLDVESAIDAALNPKPEAGSHE